METSASQTSSLFTSAGLVHKLYLKSRGKLRVHCLLHTFSVVYWLLPGQVQFTRVRRSACWARQWCSWVQPWCKEGAGNTFYPLKFTRFTQMQCRTCCNNCFDVYKLLMSNDIDRPPTSWSIYCGDEKQWIILEWPNAVLSSTYCLSSLCWVKWIAHMLMCKSSPVTFILSSHRWAVNRLLYVRTRSLACRCLLSSESISIVNLLQT